MPSVEALSGFEVRSQQALEIHAHMACAEIDRLERCQDVGAAAGRLVDELQQDVSPRTFAS